ncbi:phosphoenolpyruvate synthase [Candidatus Microgenomates bacterium]|nr:phosphoenolpyruvate synthase [Candidatus Microgenomates bacterium]
MPTAPKLIVDFKEVDKEDIPLVGGKGANLGEIASHGFPVPPGFILTTHSYEAFLEENNLKTRLAEILKHVDTDKPTSLQDASYKITSLFKKSKFPDSVARETIVRYRKLSGLLKKAQVAVRSSATAEDLPKASFAGQQATFLNIKGEPNLFEAIRDCWTSLFTPRAIFYRHQNKISESKVKIAVVVQQMVESEISGVAFTVDPITHEKNVLLIEAIWGLGEMIVQGEVVPDRYRVNHNTLAVISQEKAVQEVELAKVENVTREGKVPSNKQKRQKLNEKQIRELSRILISIHKHYYFPQDIEWAYAKKKFYIVQTRPITTLVNGNEGLEVSKKQSILSSKLILRGISASPGIATGRVVKVKSPKEIDKVQKGDILVAVMTSPDYVPAMRKVAGIVTDSGGQTSHAAIVSRELGVPCVVGTKNATAFLTNGAIITIDGAKGLVYKGGYQNTSSSKILTAQEPNSLGAHLKTATKVYVNLAEPEKAKEIASRNVDGVGLLRAEFMMANIGVHPKKVIADKKQKEFIGKLTDELKIFCDAFYPRPVVYRTTDFKTNEYRNLKGGERYEPQEPNPLLGFRGAFRYVSDPASFKLELAAIKKVREEGLNNLWLMIPFVRSPQELSEVKKIVVSAGLSRSPTFKLWMMVELPVNVIQLPDFIKIGIDGVSIGSNDLTMALIGTDRDNETVAADFNEQSPVVLWALEHTIKICHKFKVTSSICGQAPSVYDTMVANLVEWGITSISVNPDSIERVRNVIHNSERKIAKGGN